MMKVQDYPVFTLKAVSGVTEMMDEVVKIHFRKCELLI